MDLKRKLADRLKNRLRISRSITFALWNCGVINEQSAKKYLIKDEYVNETGGKRVEAKRRLANKYCVSVKTIEGYVY